MTDIDIDDGQESAPTFHSYDYFTNLLSTDENVTGTSSQRQLSDSMICEVGECGEPFWWMEPLLELTLNEQQPISGLCSSCCKKTTTAIGQTNYSQKGEVKQDVQPFTEQRKLHEALPSVSFLSAFQIGTKVSRDFSRLMTLINPISTTIPSQLHTLIDSCQLTT